MQNIVPMTGVEKTPVQTIRLVQSNVSKAPLPYWLDAYLIDKLALRWEYDAGASYDVGTYHVYICFDVHGKTLYQDDSGKHRIFLTDEEFDAADASMFVDLPGQNYSPVCASFGEIVPISEEILGISK